MKQWYEELFENYGMKYDNEKKQRGQTYTLHSFNFFFRIATFLLKFLFLFSLSETMRLVKALGKPWGHPLEYWLITDWDSSIEILCHEKPA